MTRRRVPVAGAALVLCSAGRRRRRSEVAAAGGCAGSPPRLPVSDASFDGGFNFCRLMYSSQWREAGGQGWSTDYPDADINFSIRFAELTKTRVSKQPGGVPNHFVVRATDPWLYRCPFVLGSDVGTMSAARRRGSGAAQLPAQGRVPLGRRLLGLARLGRLRDPRSPACCRRATIRSRTSAPSIRSTARCSRSPRSPQIPSIQFWRGSGGARPSVAATAPSRTCAASPTRKGDLMVLATHNTDISDAWEREGEDPRVLLHLFAQRLRDGDEHHAVRDEPLASPTGARELIAR